MKVATCDIEAEPYQRNVDIDGQNVDINDDLTCPDIEDLSISKNSPPISVRDMEILILFVNVRVLRL